MTEQALKLIDAQQPKRDENPHLWMLAEQVKDICRREAHAAGLIAADLENPDMVLEKLLKKFDSFAEKNKKGGQSVITPQEGDAIIRKFFGLTAPDEATVRPTVVAASPTEFKIVSLFDLI